MSVLDLLAEANIPVVASVGADENGAAYSVNVDTVAGELAAATGAEKIIRLTDGMTPKVTAARKALESGVASTHMVDDRVEHAVLLEILTDAGCGARVTA